MDSFIVDKKTGLGLLLAIGSRYFVEMALLKLDKLQILPESNFSYVTFGYMAWQIRLSVVCDVPAPYSGV